MTDISRKPESSLKDPVNFFTFYAMMAIGPYVSIIVAVMAFLYVTGQKTGTETAIVLSSHAAVVAIIALTFFLGRKPISRLSLVAQVMLACLAMLLVLAVPPAIGQNFGTLF